MAYRYPSHYWRNRKFDNLYYNDYTWESGYSTEDPFQFTFYNEKVLGYDYPVLRKRYRKWRPIPRQKPQLQRWRIEDKKYDGTNYLYRNDRYYGPHKWLHYNRKYTRWTTDDYEEGDETYGEKKK